MNETRDKLNLLLNNEKTQLLESFDEATESLVYHYKYTNKLDLPDSEPITFLLHFKKNLLNIADRSLATPLVEYVMRSYDRIIALDELLMTQKSVDCANTKLEKSVDDFSESLDEDLYDLYDEVLSWIATGEEEVYVNKKFYKFRELLLKLIKNELERKND